MELLNNKSTVNESCANAFIRTEIQGRRKDHTVSSGHQGPATRTKKKEKPSLHDTMKLSRRLGLAVIAVWSSYHIKPHSDSL